MMQRRTHGFGRMARLIKPSYPAPARFPARIHGDEEDRIGRVRLGDFCWEGETPSNPLLPARSGFEGTRSTLPIRRSGGLARRSSKSEGGFMEKAEGYKHSRSRWSSASVL